MFEFLFAKSSLQDLNMAYQILYKDIEVKSEAPFYVKVANKIHSLIRFTTIHKFSEPKYLLFSETINGKNALKNLVDGLRPESLELLNSCYLIRNSIILVPVGLILYIKSILFSDNNDVSDLLRGWRNHIHASHKIVAATMVLAYYNPRVIIVSNDHSPASRAMLRFGNFLGKKTVYIPHSMVTTRFPKLVASFNFLDGEVMWKQYRNTADRDCTVILSGPVRMPVIYSSLNEKKIAGENLVLGICLNQLDDRNKVEQLISELTEINEIEKIIVRLHPNQHISSFQFSIGDKVSLSGVDENIFQFIQKVDCIIAGETAVHYDALLLNRLSFYYQFSNTYLDHYNFISDGLVQRFSLESLNMLSSTGIEFDKIYLRSVTSPSRIVVQAIKSNFKTIDLSNDKIYRF